MAQRILEEEGMVVLSLHTSEWNSLEDDDARMSFLSDLLSPWLDAGTPEVFKTLQLDGGFDLNGEAPHSAPESLTLDPSPEPLDVSGTPPT